MLPAVGVSMGSQEELSQPFSGMQMRHTTVPTTRTTQQNVPTYTDKVSAPIDYATQSGKSIEIVVEQKPQEDKAITEKQAPTNERPVFKKPDKKEKSANSVTVFNPEKLKTFNIADIYLGMQPEDVIESAADNGFELTNVAYGIPSFMISDYEKNCRASGLYQTRLIHECMRNAAQDEEVYYVSQLVFERLDSKEKITVLFSSSLTNNQAFKIDYTAFGDNSLGTSYKDLLKKTHRRDIFWKYVYDKYGKAQNPNAYFWGNANKVYLRAFLSGNAMDGRIVLENTEQTGIDYTEAQAQDKEKDINNPFHF